MATAAVSAAVITTSSIREGVAMGNESSSKKKAKEAEVEDTSIEGQVAANSSKKRTLRSGSSAPLQRRCAALRRRQISPRS